MTEAEWLTCTDPDKMLQVLPGKASDRKLRLFACACCRRLWHLLTDERSRKAVEVAEQFSDCLVSREKLISAATVAELAVPAEDADNFRPDRQTAAQTAGVTCWTHESIFGIAGDASLYAGQAVADGEHDYYAPGPDTEWQKAKTAARSFHCPLLRDIFGNPFRPVAINPAWLDWNGGVVIRLAQDAYDERELPLGTMDRARMAVLADALEEAGCADAALLDHCRGPGPHVRGCWAIDLILGKK